MQRSARSFAAILPLPLGEVRGEGAWNRHPVAGASPRRGLTLVELLVAVGIIAMLVGMLTPALMGARRTALNGKVKAEIDLLHMALMNYKNEYGSFPPASFGPDPVSGARLDDPKTYTRHPVYRHLVRVFPRISPAEAAIFPALAKLSPAQALVFWLRGFYENPEFPLTNGGPAGQRKKLFDFDESRLYAASDYSTGQPQTFGLRKDFASGAFEREYPVYLTGQPSCGLPYVYFDARCYDIQNLDRGYWARPHMGGGETAAIPYFASDVPSRPLWSQCHVNPDTFQLIAAGLDGRYGPVPAPATTTAAMQEAQAAYPGDLLNFTFAGPDGTNTYSFLSAATRSGHGDNITNFAAKPLADSAASLNTTE